jgi:hypothetical protein
MWLVVLPQIIARIHSNTRVVRELIQSLLVRIGKGHPQVCIMLATSTVTVCFYYCIRRLSIPNTKEAKFLATLNFHPTQSPMIYPHPSWLRVVFDPGLFVCFRFPLLSGCLFFFFPHRMLGDCIGVLGESATPLLDGDVRFCHFSVLYIFYFLVK